MNSFRLRLLIGHMTNVDLIRRRPLIRLEPIFMLEAGRNGEGASIGRECERRDRRWKLMELTESLLVSAVPHIDEAIAAAGGERSMYRVEGDRIDRVYDLDLR